MNILIQSTLKTLQKTKHLLISLSDDQLSNSSVPPYNSSIGSHIRHILDFYDCILNEENNKVDLTARSRSILVETECNSAICYLDILESKLKLLNANLERGLYVIDDLGLGKIEIKYTFSALLAQANSHTIHHYAIINYILDRLNIELKDSDFGYNPTTPKKAFTLN